MAIVLNPLNSSEARGRVGGLVYNTWRGIHTVKTHTAPGHQDDPLRQAAKADVELIASCWRDLTQPQRDAWNHYATQHFNLDWTGRPLRLAGYHWYVRLNVLAWRAYYTLWEWPPDHECLAPIGTPSCLIHPTYITLAWETPDPDPASEYQVQIMRAGPFSAGKHATLHDAKVLARCVYSHGYYDDETVTPGTWTYWLKPIHLHGTSGTYQRLTATFV